MPARLYVEHPLAAGRSLTLPPAPSRHVQVLRLQPGAAITLFDGRGGEWSARILRIGRSEVDVEVGAHDPIDRELACRITLAVGMPANERMDALVEKATELGAARIQPLLCERSVLRLSGERADKRVAHWRGVAVAASEQSGRTRVPQIADVLPVAAWIETLASDTAVHRWMLSPRAREPFAPGTPAPAAIAVLSGPEGGLAPIEEAVALQAGFTAVSLGPRVLRADTAPIAVLAALGLCSAVRLGR